MERTSEKKQCIARQGKKTVPSKVYSVGIYARLSVDGEERKKESIETQIEIAKSFLKQQDDMVLFNCYRDIGKTGTNFRRDGFEQMMQDVRTKKIDCIIVKDLSRFGRNHIETGNYIEKIFPFLNVRFIAVTDHFDSIHPAGEKEALSVNLKNLVNEMYARDIAVKVKTSRREKWEQGGFTGGVPPYGYRAEWVGGQKRLFIEEITSDIVKRIYELFLNGKNCKEIVVWLYGQKIVRPMLYHKTGEIYCQDTSRLQEWSRGTVRRILTNPVYTGCLVQAGPHGRDNSPINRNTADFKDCLVKEHTHEAVISEEMFFEAAAKFQKNSVYCNKDGYSERVLLEEDIFAKVLFCGECKANMKRITSVKTLGSKKTVRLYSYNCPNHSRIDGYKCAGRNITLDTLKGLIRTAIHQEFALSSMRPKDLTDLNRREADRIKNEWRARLADLEGRIRTVKRLGSEQYLKYRMKETDAKTFQKEKEERDRKMLFFQSRQAAIIEKLRAVDQETAERNHFLRALVKGNEKTQLTAEVIQTLINRVEVYQDRRVKVIFAFQRNRLLMGKEDI